jgi:hypothetical protein
MIKLSTTALLAGLTVMPGIATAQFRQTEPPPRFALTPLVGYRLPYNATGELYLYNRDNTTLYMHSRERREGGVLVGAEAELRLIGQLGVSASFLYAESVEYQVEQYFEFEDEDGFADTRWSGAFRSPIYHYYKAGLMIHLSERTPDVQRRPITAALTIGPAIVREIQPPDPVPPDYPQARQIHWDPINHFAVNFGAHAVIPLGTPHVALRLGAEDYFTFWNEKELNRQSAQRFGGIADWTYGRFHLATLHAGVSVRF